MQIEKLTEKVFEIGKVQDLMKLFQHDMIDIITRALWKLVEHPSDLPPGMKLAIVPEIIGGMTGTFLMVWNYDHGDERIIEVTPAYFKMRQFREGKILACPTDSQISLDKNRLFYEFMSKYQSDLDISHKNLKDSLAAMERIMLR
jgi:hypothetical protein